MTSFFVNKENAVEANWIVLLIKYEYDYMG